MKQHLEFAKRLLLLATPLFAGSILADSPSQAATLALSDGNVTFSNFSQSPVNISTGTDSNTVATAKNGMVQAQAGATASFITAPPEAFDLSISEALGKSREYLGQAESKATLVGDFVVDAGKTFAFDFAAQLNLKTSIDNPPAENAQASGDISFILVDTDNQRVLDLFSLVGNLNTEGGGDFLAIHKSDDITLSTQSQDSHFGGQQEFATASVDGFLQLAFANRTDLALVEVTTNRARVVAPEPSNSLALLLCSGIVGILFKGKRGENSSACSLEAKVAAEV